MLCHHSSNGGWLQHLIPVDLYKLLCCSCLLQRLLSWNPFKMVRGDRQSLLETLVNYGAPLTGNSCPGNASNPLQPCPGGFYCPNEATVMKCQAGYYCPVRVRQRGRQWKGSCVVCEVFTYGLHRYAVSCKWGFMCGM